MDIQLIGQLVILLILVISFVGLLVFAFFTLLYVLPMAKGAVYVPSNAPAIAAMIKLANIKPGVKIADLGSGDGRVVAALAQAGAEAHGYEVNPLLVLRSHRLIRQQQLQDRAFIHRQSYWDVDLHDYEVVIVYGITYIMQDLADKLRDELKPGAKVLSNYFQLPGWKKVTTDRGVHLYRQA